MNAKQCMITEYMQYRTVQQGVNLKIMEEIVRFESEYSLYMDTARKVVV